MDKAFIKKYGTLLLLAAGAGFLTFVKLSMYRFRTLWGLAMPRWVFCLRDMQQWQLYLILSAV